MPGAPLTRHVRVFAALTAITTALLTAAPATANPPALEAAGTVSGGLATATWSLPSNVTSQFFEIAKSPNVNVYGYFACAEGSDHCESTLARFGILSSSQTSLTTPPACNGSACDAWPALDPGEYYVHIAGHDAIHDGCPRIEFSDIVKVTVAADKSSTSAPYGPGTGACTLIRPKPGLTGGGAVGGGGKFAGDTTPPKAQLRYRRKQDIDKLRIRGRMSEPGVLSAKALVDVGGLLAKIYTFRPVTKKASGGLLVTLPMKVAKKHKRALKRAMKRGKRLRARVTLTAVDRGGNTTTKHATIRLKP